MRRGILAVLSALLITACSQSSQTTSGTANTSTLHADVHTFSRPWEAVVRHLDLNLDVHFDNKTLIGEASYQIDNLTGTDTLILDARDLNIQKVTLGTDEKPASFQLGAIKPWLGQPLKIHIYPDTKLVHIYYTTSPQAAALQWLAPSQTAGGRYPFLFTQSESVFAKTWVPCQDGPGIRFTYNATVKVPKELIALMSASNPQEKNDSGIYHFQMDKPIPSYLLALAVGDIAFHPITDKTGVYAEPVTLDKAAYEFADMGKMLQAAEKLYGPYRWGRYDVLVLPPSFPYGGMENPRLTFATPTVLAGDRSLVSLVAHELAHSWSGNLVTNASWNDLWLNEGFTNYFERRIMEELNGKDYAAMLEVLGYEDLESDIQNLGPTNPDTRLKMDLKGRNPDDGSTNIPYEKGYFLLRYIEDKEGRGRFDKFLKQYFEAHAFQSMTTENFLDYLQQNLVKDDTATMAEIKRWVYQPGVPKSIHVATAVRFQKVDSAREQWQQGMPANKISTQGWTTNEWLHFLHRLPENMTLAQMKELDNTFHLTSSTNAEIEAAWFDHAIRHQYTEAYPYLKHFLLSVGRMKFVVPLYKELAESSPQGKEMAEQIYREAKPLYHPLTQLSVEQALGQVN